VINSAGNGRNECMNMSAIEPSAAQGPQERIIAAMSAIECPPPNMNSIGQSHQAPMTPTVSSITARVIPTAMNIGLAGTCVMGLPSHSSSIHKPTVMTNDHSEVAKITRSRCMVVPDDSYFLHPVC
jgi:hypothetical protein